MLNQSSPSRGRNSLKSGVAYETEVYSRLGSLMYRGMPITTETKTAGGGRGNDAPFKICGLDFSSALEIKNKGGFEGGGRVMKLGDDGRLHVKDENSIHASLLAEYQPFGGAIPSFLRGNKTREAWNTERQTFCDDKYEIPFESIRKYYREKGNSYIQIEGKKGGLYHLGIDPLNLGVPLFEGKAYMRIRTSKHINKKTGVPTDVQASFIFNRQSIPKSPYDLMERLPPTLEVSPPPTIPSSHCPSHTTTTPE